MRAFLATCFALTIALSNSTAQESPSVQLFEEQQTTANDQADPSASAESESATQDKIKIDAAQLQLIVNVEVAARDAGIVESINITEGNLVKTGDAIATLDRESAMASANVAASELDIAKEENENDIDLRYAKVSKDVSGKVYQRSVNAANQFAKSVSKTELERLKLEYERARLSGEQAERSAVVNELTVELKKSQMELAEVQLRNREIRSPTSGMVVQVYQQVGEWVQPGEPIARVIDLSKLRVSCRCYLEDASPESIAERATFTHRGRQYPAVVVFTSPEIDPDVQDFIVWAEVENATGELKPGMRGSIELQRRD
ncbi:efflux RND transporter periplasmic adaptor subunit [Mariniblastus fucicola]|uniref:Putative multidrug resistance protein EmrK n=1 Tax=Mariniblastus fucicola TaxID=980251 RepID=A0A5B9P4D7_9BACT|nr:efflux RND transporter periplasmic adaptor subunit [Mariniblastus fucicola]QEG21104.1 putative multidrug resistance protein EmrK [Mariniblastus fucicola]